MRKRLSVGILCKCIAGASMSLLFGTLALAAGQSHAPVPIFSPSPDTGWVAIGNDYFPPASGPGPVTFDPEYPYVPNRAGQATFRVADLGNPNLKPWAAAQMKEANDAVIAGGIGFTPRSSCMPAGVPAFTMFIREPVYFLQSPELVLIAYSGDAQMRRIHMNVPHSADPKPSWYGESVGHYDGDALVIDTIGLDTRSYVDLYRTPHSEKLHVVERWAITAGGGELEVQFTVEDEDTFYAPWSGAQRYSRIKRKMAEQPCAENNRPSLVGDYDIPIDEFPDF